MNLETDLIKALTTELRNQLPDLEGIYLFGSRVTDQANDASDWDFAYLSRMGLTTEQQWEMKTSLESKFDLDIDLVDLYKS